MTLVTKSEFLLNLEEVDSENGFVGFTDRDDSDDEAESARVLAMTVDHWVDFGRPGVITVTVVPGDQLNTEDEA